MVSEKVKRYNFMETPLDAFTVEGVIVEIKRIIDSKEYTKIVNFSNVAKVVKARKDPYLNKILWSGDFALADGKPLVKFGKWLGMNIPERVNGTNLMMDLFKLSQEEKYRVFLFGAKQEILERCVTNIMDIYPGINICGYRNGYFKKNEIMDVVDTINSAKPDILFIGMGTPQKEIFAYEQKNNLKVPIVQGVGGSFDVVAGLVERAPVWMQNWGLEWFFRVIQEPRRMFWRYFSTNIKFILIFVYYFFKRHTKF